MNSGLGLFVDIIILMLSNSPLPALPTLWMSSDTSASSSVITVYISRLSKPRDSWPSVNAIIYPVIYWFTQRISPCSSVISGFKTLIFTFYNMFSIPLAFNICFTIDFSDFVAVTNASIGNLTNSELIIFSNASKRSKSLCIFPIIIILSLLSLKADAYMYSPKVTFKPLNTAWFKRSVAERNMKLHRFWSLLLMYALLLIDMSCSHCYIMLKALNNSWNTIGLSNTCLSASSTIMWSLL